MRITRPVATETNRAIGFPVACKGTKQPSAAGRFFYIYFSLLFFTKIYFRFRNLQKYTPSAPLPGGRQGLFCKNFRGEFALRPLEDRLPGSGAAGPPGLRRRRRSNNTAAARPPPAAATGGSRSSRCQTMRSGPAPAAARRVTIRRRWGPRRWSHRPSRRLLSSRTPCTAPSPPAMYGSHRAIVQTSE